MEELAIYATMTAKPGKEDEVELFLESLSSLAEAETGTKHWFALKGHNRAFAIFDTFENEGSRTSHLEGHIALAILRRAPELFEDNLKLLLLDVLAEKDEEEGVR